MKRSILLLVVIIFFSIQWLNAQVNIIPLVGMNSTKMYQSYGYLKGGSYGFAGLELELRLRPRGHQKIYPTLITGVSYLKNGYYYSDNFSFSQFLYIASITDRKMEYVRIPVILRINWQPFPLVEDWKMFFGAGVSNNLLLSAHLREKYTSVGISSDLLAPPVTEQYEDSRDVTDLGKKQSLFTQFEIGMVYKKVQVSFRVSKSITDLYYTGLENSWAVPADDSDYMEANLAEGRIAEKYVEITIGYKLLK